MSSSPTQFKNETRKFRIEVEVRDKKNGQITKLSKEEEVELKFSVSSPHSTRKPVKKEKIIHISQNGKSYNLNFAVGEVRKGWFKDTPLSYSIRSASDDFEVINQKVVCSQLRPGGFLAVGVVAFLLIGIISAFAFWKKRKTTLPASS